MYLFCISIRNLLTNMCVTKVYLPKKNYSNWLNEPQLVPDMQYINYLSIYHIRCSFQQGGFKLNRSHAKHSYSYKRLRVKIYCALRSDFFTSKLLNGFVPLPRRRINLFFVCRVCKKLTTGNNWRLCYNCRYSIRAIGT